MMMQPSQRPRTRARRGQRRPRPPRPPPPPPLDSGGSAWIGTCVDSSSRWSIFCSKEMSASENQAAEASKGDDEKMDPPKMKIRIRLPPRKRLSNGLLKADMDGPDDRNNAQSSGVPVQTKSTIPSKQLTIPAAQCYASSISTSILWNEGNNNASSQTLPNEPNCDTSSDKLPEEASDSIPSKKLIIKAAQHYTSSISTGGLCNEANNNTSSKTLTNESNCDTSSDKLPEETIDNISSKVLTITAAQHQIDSISTGELCNEANNNTSRKILTITAAQHQIDSISTGELCNEANNNTSSKILPNEPNCDISSDKQPEEANDTIPSKNLMITAGVCMDDVSNYSAKEGLCEDANDTIPSTNLMITAGVWGHDVSYYSAKEGLCEEANDIIPRKNLTIVDGVWEDDVSNYSTKEGLCEEANDTIPSKNLIITAGVWGDNVSNYSAKEGLCEETNDIIPRKNLTITAGVWGDDVSNYSAKEGLCEEANGNIPSNAHPATIKELPAKPLESTPSKNLTTIAMLGEEENNNPLRLFHETDINIPSKVVLPKKSKNNQRRNLVTTAVKCEEANNDPLSRRFSEDANRNIPTRNLSDKTKNNAQSNRPTNPDRKNNPQKKLSTTAVHAAPARKNTSEIKMANSEMKPSTSFGQAAEQGINLANLKAIKQYQEFEEKVKRTVYLDYFSHQATESVIRTALNQFGTVREINFVVNYTIPFSIPQSALVIMETEKDAVAVVNMLNEFPFMMSGMPRPVRATRATAEMFNDRPRRPGNKLEFRWVGPSDADYHIVKKLKLMSRRHELDNLALVKHELEEEHFLAKHQEEILNCNQRKLEVMDSIMLTGKFTHLQHIYSVKVDEVFCNKWLV
uniref:RRM domain-containing protein n=1 Tax=Oryza rufipogon TaxID=4529 RepID=A0A0E0Q6B1_ORYRU